MTSKRLSSLDAFRGISIAGMILVNNPGSWQYVYAPLKHAEWHGWTLTDLVFPFFLFIVGVSISISFSRRIGAGIKRSKLYEKIVERALILFSLGILLRLFPLFNFENIRIPGVLQRIALCYLFASLLFLKTGWKGRLLVSFILLVSYWLVMKLVPVPGYGPGVLDYKGNLCAYLDLKLLAGHLYKPDFDPEGILSTLPAISTTLLGTLTGDWLQSSKKTVVKTSGLFVGGCFFAFLGLALNSFFPINKQLWTSTYVLFTAGAALVLLALCYGIIDGLGFKKWATLFLVFGTNSIAVYAGSTLMAKLIMQIKVPANGELIPFQTYIYKHLLVPWAGNLNGSLAYALIFILIWFGIMFPLFSKKIFIKI